MYILLGYLDWTNRTAAVRIKLLLLLNLCLNGLIQSWVKADWVLTLVSDII